MAGIASVITQDVPPYLTIAGNPCAPYGINSEGLKRRGFTPGHELDDWLHAEREVDDQKQDR